MKISKFYIDKARYRAEDNSGKIFWLEIDYWENGYKTSKADKTLEKLALDLLKRKHRVNFAGKLLK